MTTKRIGTPDRSHRPWSARAIQRRLRPRPMDRIVRWIGAGSRRRADAGRDTPADPVRTPAEAADNVVALTWAQTFGRAARWALSGDERRVTLRPDFCRSA